MNLPKALGFVRRWLPFLILGPLLGGVAAFLVLREIPPVYQARVTLLVGQGTSVTGTGADELSGAEQLAQTYAEIVRTRPVLEEAAGKLNLTIPVRDLQQRVSANLVRGTQLLRITAEDTDPSRAAQLANAVSDAFVSRTLGAQASRFASSRENLGRLVDSLRSDVDARTQQIDKLSADPPSPARDAELTRLKSELAQVQTTYGASVRSYEDLRITEARGMNTLTVLEPATPPDAPVRPQKGLTMLLATLAGLAIALGIAAAAEYLDDGLNTRERVAAATGLITLGVVPRAETLADSDGLIIRRLKESYRLLLPNLQVATADQQLRTLMVASAAMGEGKSMTAFSLAYVLAESGQRVILVDADLHRPTQMRLFDLSNRVGLSTLLLNPKLPAAASLQPTAVPLLQVLTAGPAPADASALFLSKRLADRLAELSALSDIVIFDTPPLMALPDAALLGSHMDAVLFVVDATRSRGRMATRAIEMLHRSGVQVAGVVLNKVPKKVMDYVEYGAEYGEPQETTSAVAS